MTEMGVLSQPNDHCFAGMFYTSRDVVTRKTYAKMTDIAATIRASGIAHITFDMENEKTMQCVVRKM